MHLNCTLPARRANPSFAYAFYFYRHRTEGQAQA